MADSTLNQNAILDATSVINTIFAISKTGTGSVAFENPTWNTSYVGQYTKNLYIDFKKDIAFSVLSSGANPFIFSSRTDALPMIFSSRTDALPVIFSAPRPFYKDLGITQEVAFENPTNTYTVA